MAQYTYVHVNHVHLCKCNALSCTVQDRMADANTVFTRLIACLEGFMFIEPYGLHLLMKHCKCIMRGDNSEHDEYTVDDHL